LLFTKETWESLNFYHQLVDFSNQTAFIIRYQQCQLAELQNTVFNLRQFLNQGMISTDREKWQIINPDAVMSAEQE
jgi:hypothetical protein